MLKRSPLGKKIKFANNFAAITDLYDLNALIEKLHSEDKVIGFDLETGYSGGDYPERSTNMYHPAQFIVGFSITNDPTWARYVPLRHDFAVNMDPNEVWPLMKPLLEEKVGVAHNILFESENLNQLDNKGDGPRIQLPVSKWHDSMIQAYVLSDVPPMPVSGSLAEGEFVRQFIPEHHRTPDDYQRDDIKQFLLNLKSLTKFRYNYDQANIHSLFNGGKELTAKQKKLIRFNTLPVDPRVIHYACDDAYLALQLHHDQMERIMADPYLPNVYSLEMRIAEMLGEMREVGVTVNWDAIENHHEMFETFLHSMQLSTRRKFEQETGRELVNLNLRSTKQIGELIFGPKEEGGLGLTGTRTTDSGALSTDDKALTTLRKQSPAIDSLLKYRQCKKMGEWFDTWSPLRDQSFDGKLHPSFIQTRIQSGRFASASPNVQNITKRWWFQIPDGSVAEVMRDGKLGVEYWTGNARDFIVASPGYRILSFDYKSAEIQFLAALAGEDTIIEAFYSGEDFHKWTASIVFGKSIDEVTKNERQAAKTVSFGLVYGQSVGAMAQQLGIPTNEAAEIRAMYFARFPKLAKYFEDQKNMVIEQSEVRTWLGRRATIWEAMHESSRVRSKAERMSVNIPVQGGATGDYTKMAMLRSRSVLKEKGWWGKEVRLLMNQHDSLVFEVHESLTDREVVDVLTPQVQFSLAGVTGCFNEFPTFPPMSVDWEIGPTWGSVADLESAPVFEADSLEIVFTEDATKSDLQSVLDVVVTNPGDTPVTIHAFGLDKTLPYKVKVHPEVLYKIKKGDPDIGISHAADINVNATYVVNSDKEDKEKVNA